MNENKDIIIEAGVNMTASVISLSDPTFGVLAAALSPIIANGLKSMLPSTLSYRENLRVEKVYNDVIKKIGERLKYGRVPRIDNAYYECNPIIPNAQEVFEGVLLKARGECQSKKIDLYSTFFANLCFDETIDIEHAQFLLRLTERLTYRQLAILAYLSDGKAISTSRWDALFKIADTARLVNYFDFYSEYVDMYNARLITQTKKMPGFALGMSETKISEMGLHLSNLLELKDIPSEDINVVKKSFDAISSIIEQKYGSTNSKEVASNISLN